MCKNEVTYSTRPRDLANQLTQEHRETLRNRVLFSAYVEHKSVVCFRVARYSIFNIYRVIV